MRIVQVRVPSLIQLLFSLMALLPGDSGRFNFFFLSILFFYRGSSRLVQTRNLLIETHAHYRRAMPVSAQQKYSNFAGIKFEVCL